DSAGLETSARRASPNPPPSSSSSSEPPRYQHRPAPACAACAWTSAAGRSPRERQLTLSRGLVIPCATPAVFLISLPQCSPPPPRSPRKARACPPSPAPPPPSLVSTSRVWPTST